MRKPLETLAEAAPELRFAEEETGTFTGYAARWNSPDSFGDVLMKGAFAATLDEHRAAGTRPLMLWSHDPSEVIGVWEELREDDVGLFAKGRLILDVARARETRALMNAGAVNGLSIGFRTRKAETRAGGGRTVRSVGLIEVSVVARPAQPLARVTQVRGELPASSAALAALIRGAAATIKGE